MMAEATPEQTAALVKVFTGLAANAAMAPIKCNRFMLATSEAPDEIIAVFGGGALGHGEAGLEPLARIATALLIRKNVAGDLIYALENHFKFTPEERAEITARNKQAAPAAE